jgi:hypothetical protein
VAQFDYDETDGSVAVGANCAQTKFGACKADAGGAFTPPPGGGSTCPADHTFVTHNDPTDGGNFDYDASDIAIGFCKSSDGKAGDGTTTIAGSDSGYCAHSAAMCNQDICDTGLYGHGAAEITPITNPDHAQSICGKTGICMSYDGNYGTVSSAVPTDTSEELCCTNNGGTWDSTFTVPVCSDGSSESEELCCTNNGGTWATMYGSSACAAGTSSATWTDAACSGATKSWTDFKVWSCSDGSSTTDATCCTNNGGTWTPGATNWAPYTCVDGTATWSSAAGAGTWVVSKESFKDVGDAENPGCTLMDLIGCSTTDVAAGATAGSCNVITKAKCSTVSNADCGAGKVTDLAAADTECVGLNCQVGVATLVDHDTCCTVPAKCSTTYPDETCKDGGAQYMVNALASDLDCVNSACDIDDHATCCTEINNVLQVKAKMTLSGIVVGNLVADDHIAIKAGIAAVITGVTAAMITDLTITDASTSRRALLAAAADVSFTITADKSAGDFASAQAIMDTVETGMDAVAADSSAFITAAAAASSTSNDFTVVTGAAFDEADMVNETPDPYVPPSSGAFSIKTGLAAAVVSVAANAVLSV